MNIDNVHASLLQIVIECGLLLGVIALIYWTSLEDKKRK